MEDRQKFNLLHNGSKHCPKMGYKRFDMEVKYFLWSKVISISRFLRSLSHGSEYLSSNFSVNSFNTSRAVEIFDSMAVGKPFLDNVRRLYVIGTLSADR